MELRTRLHIGAAATLAAAAFVHQRAWFAQRANPPGGSFITVEGVKLHYTERGAGPPLVMLHGNGSMMQEVMLSGLYELAAARYRVIVLDRPGYGHSERPRSRWWGPRSQATLLRALLSRIGVERPILFGHSFGALVAAAFALEFPTTARGLVLASGIYFPTPRLDSAFMAPPAIPLIGDLMLHTVSPLISRALWPRRLRVLFSPAPVPHYFQRFPVWMALRPSQLRAAAAESALLMPATVALQRHYEEITTPTVIVAGSQDRYVHHEHHSLRLSHRIAGSALVLSPRAGHMVHHVDPRRVLQAIEKAAR